MPVGKQVIYQGRVQGVGFRASAHRLAQDYGVSGYVRNLPDGNVELVAEGESDEVQGFLDAVDQRMGGYVEDRAVFDRPAQGLTEFRIRF